MKLLIIAGPYEADRIRKASLAAGFETVAVEPGESLSGWITASRPELIVMAPQIVHPDPALALAKVRAVPRGRVPIFLVGDEADEARMRDLADGFFVRPVAPSLLLERARAILSPGRAAGTGSRRGDAPSERTEMGLGPLPAVPSPAPSPGSGGIHAENEFSRGGRTPKSGPHGATHPQALDGDGDDGGDGDRRRGVARARRLERAHGRARRGDRRALRRRADRGGLDAGAAAEVGAHRHDRTGPPAPTDQGRGADRAPAAGVGQAGFRGRDDQEGAGGLARRRAAGGGRRADPGAAARAVRAGRGGRLLRGVGRLARRRTGGAPARARRPGARDRARRRGSAAGG